MNKILSRGIFFCGLSVFLVGAAMSRLPPPSDSQMAHNYLVNNTSMRDAKLTEAKGSCGFGYYTQTGFKTDKTSGVVCSGPGNRISIKYDKD